MNIYQIRYFLAIIEANSFTKAAQKLFVSQPSLSAGIKKLEQELEVTLFDRGGGTRKIILTQAGLLFQKRAQAILTEYQSAYQDLQKLKTKPTIRIGTLHSIRASSIVKIVSIFHKKYPLISITIFNGYLQELRDWLDQGQVDLVITWLPENYTSQTSQFLFHQSLSLAVPKDHIFTGAKSVCLADLEGLPYIERLNCEFWCSYPNMFKSAGIKFNKVYSSNNEEWVIALIQAGLGISIMPIWQDLDNITYLPIVDLSLSRVVGICWRVQKQVNIVKNFVDCAVNYDWQVN